MNMSWMFPDIITYLPKWTIYHKIWENILICMKPHCAMPVLSILFAISVWEGTTAIPIIMIHSVPSTCAKLEMLHSTNSQYATNILVHTQFLHHTNTTSLFCSLEHNVAIHLNFITGAATKVNHKMKKITLLY